MKRSKLWASVIGALSLASLSACAGSLPPPGTAAYQANEYRLAAGDEVMVTVFGERELSKKYVVSSAGDLSFPLIGDVDVANKTVTELQDQLVAILSEGYLNDPRINAEVVSYREIFILGEVERPGEFPYRDDLTVLQAVALAGGFKYRADKNRVFIRRKGNQTEETYDLRDGRPVFVAPGDIIRFGERIF